MNPSTGTVRAGDLVRAAARELQAAGVASPRRDAEALLGHVLDRDQAELSRALLMGESVGEGERAAYAALVAERAARVPLQHLTGQAHFRHLTLRVGPGVFVPRPETEVLVDLALTDLRERGRDRPVIVDLCTGSGAIALALAHEWPAARVHAVELSEDAHAWATANVERSGLEVDLRLGDATVAFEELVGAVDVVVSNPPYIPPGSVPVDPEVRDHDPEIALYGGGDDGLSVPLAVAQRAADLLVDGGVLLMEHADVQGEALVRALTAARVWSHVADHLDLTGLPRVTRAVRAPRS
ncbi:peptide chain release factor N(5)-glutamine methyltransferase [Ornithinimicrobium cryptoxanthini]|uniref:peptide chain release factor N(5)-glutamine methyltransferase n=1 Tax=Ornithinimicrobium cryptoxanthini TaxID=2934161 RepID=UPI002118F1D3|nr:peptide chain release factor N(5)-glutamine methyltransferase [Ornithinimicrobium cryptoxanthini]